ASGGSGTRCTVEGPQNFLIHTGWAGARFEASGFAACSRSRGLVAPLAREGDAHSATRPQSLT
ncbi:MAG: hypothetical protein AAF756_21410, partial [Pseudomonadota bacterium]